MDNLANSRKRSGADENTRPTIPCDERVKLWMRSGGRCAFCNKYLLGDDFFEYEIPLGEMAHIVGWKDSARSPRGKDPLPEAERNNADNLLLLCAEHHQIIDKSQLLGDFTVERLREQKRRHEARIEHLTGLNVDQDTAVLRVLGDIRGAPVEVSREHVREVVLKHANRYAYFPFAFDRQSVEINLSNLPDPEQLGQAYWESGRAVIDQSLTRLADGVRSGDIRHLSVFALARIPLLVHLGFRLDDKVPTEIYQKHRGDQETWLWSKDAEAVAFEYRLLRDSDTPEHVALLFSVSGTITLDTLPSDIDERFAVYEVRPRGATPNRDALRARASLEAFTRCYHDCLSHLETVHKPAREIHVFPAVPPAAAVVIGRGIMRNAQPALKIYDRGLSGYEYALTVNA